MALATGLAAFGLFIITLPHFTGDQHYLVIFSFALFKETLNMYSDNVFACLLDIKF